MNVTVELDGKNISDGQDNYGAGGAYPERGPEWAMQEAAGAALCLWASPEATDDDMRRAEIGEPKMTCLQKANWPKRTEWSGSIVNPKTGTRHNWNVRVS